MITFIGAGPSNIFAALYLLRHGYKDSINFIDKGKSPHHRTNKDLLFGFFGAGSWSDGKNVFAPYQDSTPYWIDKTEYVEFMKSIYVEFLGKENINISIPVPEHGLSLINGVELKQSEVWHLGTTNNVMLGKKIYDYMLKQGVYFYWNQNVFDVDFNQKKIYTEEGMIFNYDVLQIGLGKTGNKLINNLVDPKYIKPNSVHIGGRFETPYNSTIQHLVENVQYDFKFTKMYKDIELRTFCVNNKSAYIAEEEMDGRIQFNGHAYGNDTSKINNLTNFAILAEIKCNNTMELQNEMLKSLQGHTYMIQGKKFDFNSTITFTPVTIKWGELRKIWGVELISHFEDFVENLDKILGFDYNYLFFIPEIKLSPGTIDVNKENMEIYDIRDIKWVGDSCVGTRGIVPAAVSGMYAIKGLI
jgi:uncharacterized FAD-dependent dehydrogenase